MKWHGSRIGITIGLLLVTGIVLMVGSRQPPLSAASEESVPGTGMKSTVADRRNPEPQSVPAGASARRAPEEVIALCEKEGPEAALAAAKAMTGKDRETAISLLFIHLGRVDPEFAARELKGAGLSEVHRSFAVDSIMGSWTDGEKALAWVTSEFTGDLRKSGVGKALGILVRTDSKAALAYLESMPESNSRSQALADLFVSWGGQDPKAALAYLENNLSPGERASSTEYVVGAWARNSPMDAIAWVGTIQEEAVSARLLHEVAMNWSSVSPAEAAVWLASLRESPVKAGILASLAERERNSIHCGFPLTPQQPDLSWKNKPVAEMAVTDLRNWAYQDPAGARKYLEQAPQDIDLSELSITVAAEISSTEGPAAAFEWARSLPAESGTPALRLAVISWTGTDPSAAAEKLATVEPERRGVLASALAENWSSKDPAAAAAWAAGYPGSDQKSLVRTVLQQWSGLDPQGAYQWLGSLPVGESRDEGISYMIVREAPSDPKSLLPWVEMMSTPELREQKRMQLDGYLKATPAE